MSDELQNIDKILGYMVDDTTPQRLTAGEIAKGAKFENGKEFKQILHKLDKDEYVFTETSSGGTTYYFSSFEGRLFFQQGGYSGQAERADTFLMKTASDIEENRRLALAGEYNGKRLNRLTVWLAVGAIALFVWDVVKFLYANWYDIFCAKN